MAKSDLISREAALRVVNAYDYRGLTLEDVKTVTDGCAKELSKLPAVDAEPVRHGRWIQSKHVSTYYACSHCGRVHRVYVSCNKHILPNYCPDCGAKMDEEES